MDQLPEFLLVLLVRTLGHNGEVGLPDALLEAAVNVIADASLQDRLLEGRARCRKERVIQNGKGHALLGAETIAQHHAAGKIGVLSEGLIVAHCKADFLALRLPEGLLYLDFRVRVNAVEVLQVLPVQPGQLLLHIQITIEDNIGIGGVIVTPVEGTEGLVAQIRNLLRVTAGLVSVGGIREEGMHGIALQHRLRIGEGALHLIVYHAV